MLTDLPPEILVNIFQNFAVLPRIPAVSDSREQLRITRLEWGSLAKLCRTSACFKTIAEPLLYRNYFKPDTVLDPVERRSFHRFLTTLLKRPHLAKCIRNLHIGPWARDGSLEFDLLRGYPREDLDVSYETPSDLMSLCLAHVATLDVPRVRRGEWMLRLEDGDDDADIAILFSLTSHVKHIDFAMPNFRSLYAISDPLIFPQLLTPSASRSLFENLTSLSVYRSSPNPALYQYCENGTFAAYYAYPISPFLPFLNVPTLRSLQIEEAFEDELVDDYPDTLEQSSALHSLSLVRCGFPPEILQHLVDLCSGLETATFILAEDTFPATGFSWDCIEQIFNKQRHSLKNLELGCGGLSTWTSETPLFQFSSGEVVNPIESLQDFGLLRELCVDQNVFLPDESKSVGLVDIKPARPLFEVLPSNIETLVIDQSDMNVTMELWTLLSKLPTMFPRLRTIRIKSYNHVLLDDNPELVEDHLVEFTNLAESFRHIGILWEGPHPLHGFTASS